MDSFQNWQNSLISELLLGCSNACLVSSFAFKHTTFHMDVGNVLTSVSDILMLMFSQRF
jgi:hypothetical protein